MSLIFHRSFNKENVGATPVKNQIGLSLKGQQDNVSLVTPRRALGNINCDLGASKLTPLALSKKSFKTPGALKVFTENSEKPKARKKALSSISESDQLSESKSKKSVNGPPLKISCKTLSQSSIEVDEIEHCHRVEEIEDDYEDILPKEDRLSSYPEKLISWRPFCFRRWDLEDSEEEDEPLVFEEIPDITEEEIRPSFDGYPEPESYPEVDISLLELSDWKLTDWDFELPECPQELENIAI